MTYLLILGGFVLLMAGGEALVRGAVAAATRLGVSPLLIGLTLVGFGTSTPELVTSIEAALADSPGIAVGNVVGSNIANVLLILAMAAVIAPIAVDPAAVRRDGAMMIAASVVAVALLQFDVIGRLAGAAMLAGLAAYLYWCWRSERTVPDAEAARHEHEAEDFGSKAPMSLPLALLLAIGGIAVTIFGARLLVQGAIALALSLGVSDTVIGLTVVAVGTSLPELVATVIAAIRRHGDVAYGNVIGSNIYNILGILGATAMVSPLEPPASVARLDVWIMLAAAVVAVALARTGHRLTRAEGGLMLAAYGGYVAWLVATASGA